MDALLRTKPLSAATIACAERLHIVSRHGVGYDAVDYAALNARGIALAVCGDVNSTSVAEHAAMMIMAASKRALPGDRAVRQGPRNWRHTLQSQDLRGRNLLLGYGRIGRHIAAMMAGFGMTIHAHDSYLSRKGWPDGPFAPADDLYDGLGWTDIVSVSAPCADKPLLGPAEFDAMRPGMIVVNTARGGGVDEAALVAAVETGKVAPAGLDVFGHEPRPRITRCCASVRSCARPISPASPKARRNAWPWRHQAGSGGRCGRRPPAF